MQFLITAYDGTDNDALSRRMRVRPSHLENMRKVMENNKILCAGGIISDEGKPVGSFLIMDFPSRESLDKYLETEPYVTEKVWESIKIETCNPVILDNEMGE
ncbi:MAG: hypothetical protein IKL72_03245 [Firmicutes bacterium]|nr:hypothetical protein [Bacillota bacterium]